MIQHLEALVNTEIDSKITNLTNRIEMEDFDWIKCVALLATLTYELKSGRISGVSAQHWRMILIASGGAAPFDTDGRIRGGGFFNLDIISSADNDSMQYGSPRTTTSCIIIPNE